MIMAGLYEGMIVQMVDATTKSDSGEVLIQAKNFRETEQIKYSIKDSKPIEDLIKKDSRVESYVTKIRIKGLIATAGYAKNVPIIGVDLEEEIKQSGLDNYVMSGELTFGKRDRGVIIGQTLAKDLKIKVGKKVIITTQDINNEVVSIALKVKAITNSTGLAKSLLMSKTKLQKNLGLGNSVSQICIIMKKRADSTTFANELKRKEMKNIAVYDWTELYAMLKEMEMMMSTVNIISYAFVFLVASLGIFGVVLVSVLERIREFGIMMAIGTRFIDIAKMIIFESLIISTIGYIVGAIFGALALIYLSTYGIDFSAFDDAFLMFGMDPNMKAVIKSSFFTDTLIAIYIATILAVLLPIRTLKKRKPVESIKEL
jgi:ABC-type lipoprotein release transport system permease subunit